MPITMAESFGPQQKQILMDTEVISNNVRTSGAEREEVGHSG